MENLLGEIVPLLAKDTKFFRLANGDLPGVLLFPPSMTTVKLSHEVQQISTFISHYHLLFYLNQMKVISPSQDSRIFKFKYLDNCRCAVFLF